MTRTTMLPLGVSELRDGELACASCGIAVAAPVERIEFRTNRHVPQSSPANPQFHESMITLSRCADCSARLDLAGQLLDANPGVRHAIGSRSVGLHRLSGALDGLAAIGVPLPKRLDARAVWSLVNHLAAPGIGAHWSNRYSPFRADDAEPGQCATEPWAAVSIESLSALREAAAVSMAERIDAPVTVACPSGGCALCGVSQTTVMRTRAANAWRPFTASASALGGTGLSKISGHLCPTCQAARDEEGTVGVLMMSNSVLRVVAPGRTFLNPPEFPVVAWAVTGTSPSPTPWRHLGDLDQLRQELRTGGHF